MPEKERIILGIDPGTTQMGYGLIQIQNKEPLLLTLGVVDLKKFLDHYLKLKRIFERVLQLIDQYHPDEMAIEAPFFGKNVQSMLKLGRAQGVAMSAALYRSIPIFEYAPRKIKLAVTGQGNASKEQVALFMQRIFKIKELHIDYDATDGLAAALCHYHQSNVPDSKKSFNSWKDFINKNPGRVK